MKYIYTEQNDSGGYYCDLTDYSKYLEKFRLEKIVSTPEWFVDDERIDYDSAKCMHDALLLDINLSIIEKKINGAISYEGGYNLNINFHYTNIMKIFMNENILSSLKEENEVVIDEVLFDHDENIFTHYVFMRNNIYIKIICEHMNIIYSENENNPPLPKTDKPWAWLLGDDWNG